jgi:drug/metabolite transporter (DMT)-like permease
MSGASDNMRGAIFMMAAMAGFVLNDTLMKLVSTQLSLFQAVLLRGLLVSALIGLLAWRQGALPYRPRRRDARAIGLRVVGELGATACFLTALFNMPLANATAILQAMPLTVTLGAALVFREPVGWRRYLAIGLGFTGVLIIVRPGMAGFTGYSLWALAAVLFMALRDLATRTLPPDVPSLFVAFATAASVTTMAAVLALAQPWRPVTGSAAGLLAGAALFVFVGYLFSILSVRVGEIGFVAPFRYTNLVFAIASGLLVFGDRLDGPMLLGSAIVVAMGLYAFHRERVRARPAAPRPVPSA